VLVLVLFLVVPASAKAGASLVQANGAPCSGRGLALGFLTGCVRCRERNQEGSLEQTDAQKCNAATLSRPEAGASLVQANGAPCSGRGLALGFFAEKLGFLLARPTIGLSRLNSQQRGCGSCPK
jgi:hypothetical protein